MKPIVLSMLDKPNRRDHELHEYGASAPKTRNVRSPAFFPESKRLYKILAGLLASISAGGLPICRSKQWQRGPLD